ncbi:alpha/beta-hydrolase family protein [Streptosporangium soli]|nr:alpha/beta-hydrolase family protein [Streptosporangium sp. KLBMP 9127]
MRRRLGIGGTVVAVGFFCASLSPSLLPRSWILQGIVGGVAAGGGYALGSILSALLRRGFGLTPSPRARAVAWRLLVGGGTVICLSVLWFSSDWQREVRRTMGMDTDIAWFQPLIAVLAVVTFVLLLALGRSVRLATRKLISLLGRFIPATVAKVVGLALAVFLVMVFANDVLFGNFIEVMNNTSSLANRGTSPGVSAPVSSSLSGSPGSLVSWDSLGRMGRDFTGKATRKEDLEKFAGGPAADPIRVYVGLDSAPSFKEQVRLAVRELKRTGAFERDVLVVMGSTGTGWVDSKVADAIEYMYAGDTALVSMQYSQLPSWLSFIVDRDKAAEAGSDLIEGVRAEWARLPMTARPKLLVFGESLGSYGIEEAFEDFDDLIARTDGALLVGPPNLNPIWRSLIAGRDPGSPMWRPVYQGGLQVRFGQFPQDLREPGHPDVVYLQNASDPVIWWSPDLLWDKPGWMVDPRGPDVAPAMRWYPVVTFWQVVVDLVFANHVPPGHGHQYGPNVVDGWAAVAPPDDWDEGDTARLKLIVQSRR